MEGGSPGSQGCLSTVYINSFETTWRGFMTDMNRTFFWDSGDNHHGQLMLAMMASTVTPTAGLIFREFIDVRRVEDAGEPDPSRLENVLRYQYDYAPIEGTYRSGVIELRDIASIAGYGGEFSSGSVIDLRYTRDAATAGYCMARYLADRATAPVYPSVVTPVVVYCREHGLSVGEGSVRLSGRLRTGGSP